MATGQAHLRRTAIKWLMLGGITGFSKFRIVWKWHGTGFCLQEFVVLEHPGSILEAGNMGERMGRVSEYLTIFLLLLLLFNLTDSRRRS